MVSNRWDGGLADGEGLWTEREEVGDGLGASESVPRGPSGLSAGGRGDSMCEGRGCNALFPVEVLGIRGGCGSGWVGCGMRRAPGRLNLLRAG